MTLYRSKDFWKRQKPNKILPLQLSNHQHKNVIRFLLDSRVQQLGAYYLAVNDSFYDLLMTGSYLLFSWSKHQSRISGSTYRVRLFYRHMGAESSLSKEWVVQQIYRNLVDFSSHRTFCRIQVQNFWRVSWSEVLRSIIYTYKLWLF